MKGNISLMAEETKKHIDIEDGKAEAEEAVAAAAQNRREHSFG